MSDNGAPSTNPLRARFRLGGYRARRAVLGIRIVAAAALAIYALSTPGFTTQLSLNALLNAIPSSAASPWE
jgi:hypothetical protein